MIHVEANFNRRFIREIKSNFSRDQIDLIKSYVRLSLFDGRKVYFSRCDYAEEDFSSKKCISIRIGSCNSGTVVLCEDGKILTMDVELFQFVKSIDLKKDLDNLFINLHNCDSFRNCFKMKH